MYSLRGSEGQRWSSLPIRRVRYFRSAEMNVCRIVGRYRHTNNEIATLNFASRMEFLRIARMPVISPGIARNLQSMRYHTLTMKSADRAIPDNNRLV